MPTCAVPSLIPALVFKGLFNQRFGEANIFLKMIMEPAQGLFGLQWQDARLVSGSASCPGYAALGERMARLPGHDDPMHGAAEAGKGGSARRSISGGWPVRVAACPIQPGSPP